MNGKETKILTQVATHIEHIRTKQTDHDKILVGINEKLSKGAGKIASNRASISFLKWTFGFMVMVLLAILGVIIL